MNARRELETAPHADELLKQGGPPCEQVPSTARAFISKGLKMTDPKIDAANLLYENSLITSLDYHFARFISGLCGDADPDVFLGAALVSNAAGKGDVYLDLNAVAGKPLFSNPTKEPAATCPQLPQWSEKMRSSPVVGKPGEFRPLIMDDQNRLYLYRYWEYEKNLSDLIRSRAQKNAGEINAARIKESLARLFPFAGGSGTDWQKVAALTAALKSFCVISGGPGTGKTYAVAKILALLIEQNPGKPLEILLTAPTGKAAAMLSESIKNAKRALECREDVVNAIPSEAGTIHRVLRTIPGSPYFFHDAERPLQADVVVVDEASMVDLALMSKLIAAVPADARLVLIGDKDQLASVEAGSVLGDICDRNSVHGFSDDFRHRYKTLTGEDLDALPAESPDPSGLGDAIVILRKSYRFCEENPINALSRNVNLGNADDALELLKTAAEKICWEKVSGSRDFTGKLAKILIKGYSDYLKTDDPQKALENFNRFQILCAVNAGTFGVDGVNRLAEQVLSTEGLIDPVRDWYKGRPVMIVRNDYHLGLFNGDIGITLPAPGSSGSELNVYFPDKPGRFRRFPLFRIPEHETVYAMTVHKSQGSEFTDVVLVLPDRDYPVLTRELLYTAITRARESISIWGTEEIVRNTIHRKTERASGLRDALWRSRPPAE